jgi:hypothetical protein
MNETAMQFVRVISRVEDMEIWNANRNGFSFVISYESRSDAPAVYFIVVVSFLTPHWASKDC